MDFEKEKFDDTKEIQTLNELNAKALNTLEEDILEEMDENIEEAEAVFLEEVNHAEPLEKMENDLKKQKKTWKEKMQSLKEKWQNLPKKKKVLFIILIVLFLLLVAGGIFFAVKTFSKKDDIPNIPDVIVDEDNYRYLNGTLTFIDENKKELGTYECQNKDQNLCYVAYLSDEDLFDEPKSVYEDDKNVLRRSLIYQSRFAFIYDNKDTKDGLITLYDFKENKEIGIYSLVKAYDKVKNKVVLKNKMSQYGLFELTEDTLKPIIDFSYDYIGIIQHNKGEINQFVTKRNGKWYLTDFADKTLTKAIDNPIRDYNDKFVKVTDDKGNYHLVDYNNTEVNTGNYQYIDLIENYVFYVENNKLMIRDFENHKMIQEEIMVHNTDFVRKSIYDKENKLIKSTISYEYELNGKTLSIDIFDGTDKTNKVINLNEGRLSATQAYVDYFEGKLYFYSDSEKTKLLGNYTCSNKNVIDDSTTSFNNCKLATEVFYASNDREVDRSNQLSVLPIYNERFVFISDTPTAKVENDNNVVLYNLRNSKEMAKYRNVDAGVYNGAKDASFVTVNDSFVIAENKNGKFGAIKIGLTAVNPGIEFQYDHLERSELNFIAKNSSGYFLMNNKGTVLTKTYTSKIRDYNSKYVTVFNDGKYYLYDYEGKSQNVGFDYIKLYDNYFAGVNNKTLNIYAYQKPTQALLESGVSLHLDHYYGEEPYAFKITFRGTKASISIGTPNKTYQSLGEFSLNTETDGKEDGNETEE